MAVVFIFTAMLLTAATVAFSGSPATLTLERAFPTNHGIELNQLKARDLLRHGRFLQSSSNGVADFAVHGTFDPFQVG